MNNDTLNKHHFYIINEYQTHKLFEERPFDLLLGRLKNLKILWKFIKKVLNLLIYHSSTEERQKRQKKCVCGLWIGYTAHVPRTLKKLC